MANKKRKNGGQTFVLVLIICLLIVALAFIFGQSYVINILEGINNSASASRIYHKSNLKEDDNKLNQKDNNIEEEKNSDVKINLKDVPQETEEKVEEKNENQTLLKKIENKIENKIKETKKTEKKNKETKKITKE